ncbi:peptidoglycan-binding protein [Neobacillus mesonae]|uniref:peptidoglycan-binding protein n=1 Tax=Neobacillus mesonae TaxID=1193713 RepID=UPI001FD0755F|nr:peptidoglycan-binding protein [Neobacillus mesonae]
MTYEQRNLENIAKLADHTKAAALKWHAFLIANDINILVYHTIRTVDQQREYYNNGASKTMRSYHLVGQALDFVPTNDKGETLWSDYNKPEIKKAIAEAKRLGFEWGGEWKTFIDKPHLQFNYKGYGTDTFTKDAPKSETKAEVYEEPKKEVTKPSSDPGNATINFIQATLNSRYKSAIKSDGYYGPQTKQALLKGLQTELNKQFNARLVVDGIWGPKTEKALATVREGARGNIAWIIQAALYCKGFDPKGIDGIFGAGTKQAVLAFQCANCLVADGIVGKNTFGKLFK